MSNDTATRDDADLPPEDDPDVQAVIEHLGGLADTDTAQRIVAERRSEDTENTDDTGSNDGECCELCDEKQATELGVLVVNTRAYPACPLCDDCYTPIEDLSLPRDVDREQFTEMHEQLSASKNLPA